MGIISTLAFPTPTGDIQFHARHPMHLLWQTAPSPGSSRTASALLRCAPQEQSLPGAGAASLGEGAGMKLSPTRRDQEMILKYQRPLWTAFKGPMRPGETLKTVVPDFYPSVQALFDQGYSLTDVGLMFGLSRERIRQLARQGNLRRWPTRSPKREWSWEHGRFIASREQAGVIDYRRKRLAGRQRRQAYLDGWEERFWERIAIGAASDHWYWQGKSVVVGRGVVYGGTRYGISAMPGRSTMFAHRIVWLLVYGELPEGLSICHTCDIGLCLNPAHLFAGTPAENIHDAIVKGRHIASPQRRPELLRLARQRRKQRCHRGHLLSGANLYEHKGRRACKACHAWRYQRKVSLRQAQLLLDDLLA